MQIPEKSGKTTLDELSQALSAVSSDLAGYLTLAEHAVAFRSVAQDLMLPPLVVVLVFVLLAPLLVDVLVELFPVGLELLHASAPIPRPNTATAPTRQLNRTEFMALSFSN